MRDTLLGKPWTDIDIATSATPSQVRELFGHHNTIAVGAAFGVIMVLTKDGGKAIEVATFRQDASYSDGRHPDSVSFCSAEEDAARRDFTINGMFYDHEIKEPIDHVGGQADLEAGIIRAIGDPQQRFAEDRLRLIRAVRFAAALNFEIESQTMAAIEQQAAEITVISAERIHMELRRILTDENRHRGLQLLKSTGLWHHIVPELSTADDEAWQQLFDLADNLENPAFAVVMTACWYQLAPEADTDSIRNLSRRLTFSNVDTDTIVWLTENRSAFFEIHQQPWSQVQRLLIEPHIHQLVDLASAYATVHDLDTACLTFARQKLALPDDQLNPPALLSGDDLIECQIQPGPLFRVILERVRNAQLDGDISDHQSALDLAKQLASEA